MGKPSTSMKNTKKESYKYCIVPSCRNTTIRAPDKVFFHVPGDTEIRRKWCQIMNKDMPSPSTSCYCCEDHFDVEDMEYRMMNLQDIEKSKLRLKKGVLPHKFPCEKLPPVRKYFLKRKYLEIIDSTPSSKSSLEAAPNLPSSHKHTENENNMLIDDPVQVNREIDNLCAKTKTASHICIPSKMTSTPPLNSYSKTWIIPHHAHAEPCSNTELGSETEYQLEISLEGSSGPPPARFTQHLDVKPDPLCTDNDNTWVVNHNFTDSESKYFHIKTEPEDDVPASPLYSAQDLDVKPVPHTDTNIKEFVSETNIYEYIKREPQEAAPSESQLYIILDKSREVDAKNYIKPVEFDNIKKEIDDTSYNNDLNTAISIKSDGDGCRRITVMEKYPKLKVVLTDCYTSLLDSECYCAQCAVLFATAEARSEHHTSTHVESALVTCNKLTDTGDICMKSFGNRGHLKRHNLIHTGEKPYECESCEKKFKTRFQLNRHKPIHTGEKPLKCELCKKKFRKLSTLNKHKSSDYGQKPYECESCQKKFRQVQHLNRHKLIHTGEKPFECEICQKTFSQLSNLDRHKLIHTGEKPFVCKICDKSFREQCTLKVHILIHTGERPFECETCQQTFTRQGHLNRHKLTHTGEKPFECKTCGNKYRDIKNLRRHEIIHTAAQPLLM
ncbi:zinc finger protein 543 isoform X1 [Plutella xylostella]|uniref:zinc finger protein 543 isoform X1 n=1 Tax=Plutella xylostella TaxID=51655 RepID=UPI0020322362|nr:zinc finger protein 543 isoform X1 [Plutella xylostella]XP_048480209.1 zinc finger protein 543 isoform X1 [Plutella xylostella]